jgi:hypothetical protein
MFSEFRGDPISIHLLEVSSVVEDGCSAVVACIRRANHPPEHLWNGSAVDVIPPVVVFSLCGKHLAAQTSSGELGPCAAQHDASAFDPQRTFVMATTLRGSPRVAAIALAASVVPS